MGPHALIYPVMAQILLSFVMIVAAGRARIGAVRAGRVRTSEIALRGDAWPDDVRKLANNMQNQFETPILFFALSAAATYIGATGLLTTLLAWAYVAARIGHAAIHTTSNNVLRRLQVFVAGLCVLAAMWLIVLIHLVGGA